MCYYSDLTATHLTTEAKENKDNKELLTDVVVYKSPVSQFSDVPVTERQITSGRD